VPVGEHRTRIIHNRIPASPKEKAALDIDIPFEFSYDASENRGTTDVCPLPAAASARTTSREQRSVAFRGRPLGGRSSRRTNGAVFGERMIDHISVCICTYHRNPMLERLLVGLAAQETSGAFDFSAVVVDNDPAGPARETVERLRAKLPLEIVFGIEPVRTIPAARNHALRLARGNYIAIIDDDEFPPSDWLLTLHRAVRLFKVDGVLGPVIPYFESRPPAWLVKGRFCERPVLRTGTLLDWNQTRTGNVLLAKDVFDVQGLSFDLKWQTSGSDRAFFKRAMAAGFRFVAVAEAPVYEIVPPERWTKSYYWKRALVHGYNSYRNSRSERRGISTAAEALKSFAAVAAYAAALPVCACLGSHRLVRCLEGGGHHLSRLAAVFGIELVRKRDF
jgi:succinoglycan biosynthesis protein ExoM